MEMVADLKLKTRERSIGSVSRKKWEYEVNMGLYHVCLPLMWILIGWVYAKKLVWRYLLKQDYKRMEMNINSLFFDGLSRPLRDVKKGAASWRALDLIYNYDVYRRELELRGTELIISDFWFHMRNAQAVRNRKRIVVEKLSKIILNVFVEDRSKKPRIFSIASGSAQAVFEAVKEIRVPVEVMLLDRNQGALNYSYSLLEKMGLEHLISLSTVHGRATNCEEEIKLFDPDVVEMVGFLDYRLDKKAIRLIGQIYNSVREGTYFLTANICPNVERHFLAVVINWNMIYRKEKELEKIIIQGGFLEPEILVEPQGIHAIAIAQK